MNVIKIENESLDAVVTSLKKTEMIGCLGDDKILQVAQNAVLMEYEMDEVVVNENDPSNALLMVIEGRLSVLKKPPFMNDYIELGRIDPYTILGEIGVLLNQPRSLMIKALKKTRLLSINGALFNYMFESSPAFGMNLSRRLAQRVQQFLSRIPLPVHDHSLGPPSDEVLKMVPLNFMIRHRILPLRSRGNWMDVGFVNDPSTKIMSALERFFPGAQIKPFSISYDMFESVMETQAGADIGLGPQTDKEKKDDAARAKASVLATARADKAEILDQLLKKIVAEGASDLHLSANEAPYWRIDGELKPIQGMKVLEGEEVLQLMLPLLDKHSRSEFMKTNDTDFGYTLPGVSRFRINMFRDHKGVGASIRVIPSTIFSFEQLGLPTALKELCNHPKGIVLVTGPTGSGKSTTLAAMIDYINKNRKEHIITLEDPIEFVYQNNLCLIHQREVGDHTQTFARGLRACLREDPDIVLIGELRDLEVIRIALETANTGHLVFGTLHTSTAISSLTRIIDAFPPEEQNQVRTSLSDTIKGVVSQTLCKCIGGGRVAAVEVLVVSTAVSNLILKQKFNQIASYMQTGKEAGNRVLNEELEKLVKRKKISREEAFSKALDKEDLRSRLEAAHVLARQQMSKGGDHD